MESTKDTCPFIKYFTVTECKSVHVPDLRLWTSGDRVNATRRCPTLLLRRRARTEVFGRDLVEEFTKLFHLGVFIRAFLGKFNSRLIQDIVGDENRGTSAQRQSNGIGGAGTDLDAIEENDYDNFSQRAYVPKMKKLMMLPTAWQKAQIADTM